jgi:hypothetical protein
MPTTNDYVNIFSQNKKQETTPPEVISNQTENRYHLGHLKDLEMSKYKLESKGRTVVKFNGFIFVNCSLIKSVKI